MAQYPLVARQGGNASVLNITAATVVKALPGTLFRLSVITAGTTVGALYDAATLAGNTAANQIASVPDVVGSVEYTWPCNNGILVVPGTGQVLSVSFA